MTVTLDIENHCDSSNCPEPDLCQKWVELSLRELQKENDCNLSLRFVSADESRDLNQRYRNQEKATNVLSFPAQMPNEISDALGFEALGDLVICPKIAEAEADEQHKPTADHFAHLIVHGLLHLLGHDHQEAPDAELMENLEIQILKKLGIPNPYLIG